MKQTRSFLLHTAAFSIAVLALSTSAWAQVTGTVWQVTGNEPTLTASTPVGTNIGTFNASAINFTTGADAVQIEAGISLNTDQVLYGFLTDNGATITTTISGANLASIMTGSTTGASQAVNAAGLVNEGGTHYLSTASSFDTSSNPGCYDGSYTTSTSPNGATNCYAEIIVITGTATFVAGQTYGVTHDDGAIMNITSGLDAGNVISSAGATPAITSNFTVGTTETDTFTIWYEATNGNPSVLEANFGTASTPEPGSLSLLFTMLGGIAGLALILKKKLA